MVVVAMALVIGGSAISAHAFSDIESGYVTHRPVIDHVLLAVGIPIFLLALLVVRTA